MSSRAYEESLPRFSLERRVTVLVLLATAVVVGAIATLGIPLELFPRGYSAPSLNVQASWQQAPSQEMLDKVALPLEEELATVPGLSDIYTFATTGFTRCLLRFKIGTDMDVAYREVRDRVERAKARLPDDTDRILIQKQESVGFPVFGIGLAIEPDLVGAYDLIQKEIILPLRRLEGVAAVDPQGLEEKEILIELDRQRVNSAGLNIYELSQELSSDNFTLASGHVYTGGRKLLLRSMARFPDLEALENRLVAPSVRLKDVAEVKYEEPEKRYRARIGSRPAVALMVFKEGEANAIAVSDAIDAAVKSMQRDPRLEQVRIEPFLNQGELIRESLRTLLSSGAVGGLLAILVLFFFLRRLRLTLIITLAIPLSLVIGLTAMYFAGETLNIISLLGLMISVALTRALVVASPAAIPRQEQIAVDLDVVAFTFTLALVVGAAVGLVPALRASRAAPGSMRESGRSSAADLGPCRARRSSPTARSEVGDAPPRTRVDAGRVRLSIEAASERTRASSARAAGRSA